MQNENKNLVAIMCLGTELTQGFTLNTNAHWMASRITALGLDVAYEITLPDDASLWNTTWNMMMNAGVKTVIVGGGLGPTADDKTRTLVANAIGEPLEFHAECIPQIRAFVESRGFSYSETNNVQAFFPRTARILENPVGSAPGFCVEKDGVTVFAVPGVPFEAKTMFELHIEPFLKALGAKPCFYREMRISGIFESEIAKRFEKVRFPKGVSWSSLPERDCIVFRTYTKDSPELLENVEKDLAKALGSPLSIVSTDGKDLVETVANLFEKSGETFSTAESCTGGMIASEIVNVPGASRFFKGGACTYRNEAKRDILGVSQEILDKYTEVSEETACAMAEGARKLYGTDWAVSTTGIAGPGGGTPEKPVGLVWIGIASNCKIFATKHFFSGNRGQIREKSVFKALNLLRRSFIEHKSTCTKVQ